MEEDELELAQLNAITVNKPGSVEQELEELNRNTVNVPKPKPNKAKSRSLYDAATELFDLGTYEEFETKLQNPEKRKALYEGIKDYYDVGETYEEFEKKLTEPDPGGSAPSPTPDLSTIGKVDPIPKTRLAGKNDLSFGKKKESLQFTQNEYDYKRAMLDYDTAVRKQQEANADTGQGRVMSTIGAINQAFYGLPADILDAIAIGAKKIDEQLPKNLQSYDGKEIKDLATAKAADWYRNALKELAPTNPAYRDELQSKVGSALGSLASLVLTGGVTKGAQAIGGVSKLQTGNAVLGAGKELLTKLATPVALQGGIQMGVSEFRQAKQSGASDDVAFDVFLKNAAVGSVLEQIPIGLFYKRLDSVTGGGLKQAIKKGIAGGVEEMTTEVLQQGYSNLKASETYDHTRKILDGMGESGGIGFGLGFVLNAMGVSLKNKRSEVKTDKERAEIDKALLLVDEQARKNLVSTEKSIPYQQPAPQAIRKTAGDAIAELDNRVRELYNKDNMSSAEILQAAEQEKQLNAQRQIIEERVIDKKTGYAQESLKQAQAELETLNAIIDNPPSDIALQRAAERLEKVQSDIEYWTAEIGSILNSIDVSTISLDELLIENRKFREYTQDESDIQADTDNSLLPQSETDTGADTLPLSDTNTGENISQLVSQSETNTDDGLQPEAAAGTQNNLETVSPEIANNSHAIESTPEENKSIVAGNVGENKGISSDASTAQTETGNIEPDQNTMALSIEQNKQEAQTDSGLQNINSIVYTPSTGLGFIADDFIRPAMKKAGKFFQKWFTANGFLPTQVFKDYVKTSGAINSGLKQVEYTAADFRKAVNKAYKGKVTEQTLIDINKALGGDKAIYNALPVEVQTIVTRMRGEIDNLSRRMINEGIVKGDMAAKVQNNLGVYLYRSYRKFDDPVWAEEIDPVIINRARAYIEKEYKARGISLTDAERDGIINELLFNPEAPMALIRGGKLGSKDVSALKNRKDIAPEIRALIGEYNDPLLNYARSVVKMVNLIEKHHFLNNVKTFGLNNFLFEQPNGEHYVQIAGEGSATMSPLNGLYTTPEIAEAFNQFNTAKPNHLIYEYWMKALAVVKFAKTVGSVTTHIRNFLSNTAFVIANGHLSVGKAKVAGQTVLTDLSKKNDTAFREAYKRYARLGIVGDSAGAGEMRAILKDAMGKEDFLGAVGDGKLKKLKDKVVGTAVRLYQSEDDIYKIYAFENEFARYQKAYPDKPVSEVEQMAAEIVRNTYPTYSMAPNIVKALRAFPVTGTFVSFPAEVIRTTFNTIAQARKELSNPETKNIGVQRMSGILAVSVLFSAIPAISRYMYGISDEEEEDLRQFVAPWSKNSQLLYTSPVEGGKTSFIDLSYVDPHAYLKRPVIALLDGKGNMQEQGLEVIKELYEPFLGLNMLAEAMLEVRENKKQTGGQIYNEQAPIGDQLYNITGYMLSLSEPGTVTSFKRIYKGLNGEVKKTGEPYEADKEALATFTGQRITDVNVELSLKYKMYEFGAGFSDAEKIYEAVANSKGSVPDEEKQKALHTAVGAVRNNIEKLRNHIQGARRLGVSEDKIMLLIKELRISRAYKMLAYTESDLPDELLSLLIRVNNKEKLTAEERENGKRLIKELGLD